MAFSLFDNPVTNFITGNDAATQRSNQEGWDLGEQRRKSKEAQMDYLNTMDAPKVAPETLARIKALEAESAPTSLVQDPYFQGNRAAIVQGGQQALSGVQNRQNAFHTAGGFANQGSVNDVYDRLGTQLSQLGQQSTQLKEHKRDMAAQARQSIVDNQVAYDNSIKQAKAAIEAGDSAAATQAIQMAFQQKEAIANSNKAMVASLFDAGAAVATKGGSTPVTSGAGNVGMPQQDNPYQQSYMPSSSSLSYSSPQSQPWSIMSKRGNS